MDSIYSRTEIILGKENTQKIKKASICICGVGGVGSYALEALARVGIGNICIICCGVESLIIKHMIIT